MDMADDRLWKAKRPQQSRAAADHDGSALTCDVGRLYRKAKMLSLPDGAICYLREGIGPVVTLLHGIPLSLLTWRHNITDLARSWTVVAFDMKGFGRSEGRPGDYTPEAHASVLGQLLDALGVQQTSLIASSYGCAPAIRFTIDNPTRVRRLILINSVGYADGRHSIERLLRIGFVAALMKSALRNRKLGRALFMARFRRSYTQPEAVDEDVAERYFRSLVEEGVCDSFLNTLRQFRETEFARRIPEISRKTLIVWGDRDKILPVRNAWKLHADIRGSRLEILKGCGHFPHEEAPKQVDQLIDEFLADGAALEARAIGR